MQDSIEQEELNKERSATILPCCRATIDELSANNDMMVCSTCKQIIKIFSKESAFNNYLKFCKSRSRETTNGDYGDYYVVVFNSYD